MKTNKAKSLSKPQEKTQKGQNLFFHLKSINKLHENYHRQDGKESKLKKKKLVLGILGKFFVTPQKYHTAPRCLETG